uniref:THAP-type domain-containing protein n=1 Tax=Schizaphis graminum TaxID=13262 RepID=A0A2S2PQ93_SCHGA
MVYSKCLYCGSSSKYNTDLSFHLFPKNSLRDQWLKSLGLANASKWDKLCSKHFDKKYYLDGYAKKKLVRDAIPTPNMIENTNIYEVPMAEHHHDSSKESINLHGSPVLSVCYGFSNDIDDTLTPQYQSKRKLFPSASPKKKMCSSSRFGDLSEEDFSTPRRAMRNFRSIQSTIKHLRQKNRCLMQTNKRLLHKVETLNDALKELNDKCLLSDYAINNLKVLITFIIFILVWCLVHLLVWSFVMDFH